MKMIDSEKVIAEIDVLLKKAEGGRIWAEDVYAAIRKYTEQPVSGDDNPLLEASFIADSISDYGKEQFVSGGVDAPKFQIGDLVRVVGEYAYDWKDCTPQIVEIKRVVIEGELTEKIKYSTWVKGEGATTDWTDEHLELVSCPYLKQPTRIDETLAALNTKKEGLPASNTIPADETLRDVRHMINSLETAVRKIIHTSGVLPLLTELEQALSQPSKPAITREELVKKLATFLFIKEGGEEGRVYASSIQRGGAPEFNGKRMWEYKRKDATEIITALAEVGVLNVRAE